MTDASPTLPDPSGTTADFWFDPTCPWTWRTSRWLVDVADRVGVGVRWHVMSLAVVHSGSLQAEDGSDAAGTAALRALVAAEQSGGQEALAKLYTLLGTRKHDTKADMDAEMVTQAVADAGLSESIAAATEDSSYDAAILTSHDQSQQRAGEGTGSPVLALDDSRGYFGPVITEVPAGDAALRLFEALRLLASVPAFAELKTTRS